MIVGLLMSFGFWLIDLEFWLIIGMIAGFLNIIPFVGPWVGGVLGVSVGFVTGSVTTALWAGVVAVAVQQIDNNFVSPTVLRATVRLHPAVVILVLIFGGAVGGLWGVLLAVPAAAAVKIVAGHLWRTRVLGQSWAEATEAALLPPPPRPSETLWRGRWADSVTGTETGSNLDEGTEPTSRWRTRNWISPGPRASRSAGQVGAGSEIPSRSEATTEPGPPTRPDPQIPSDAPVAPDEPNPPDEDASPGPGEGDQR